MMDVGLTATIIGALATIVFGIWAIYLAVRYRSQGRLVFIQESCIGLFESIIKNLPDLKILYKEKPISENLALLKGFLLNTGHRDISQGMVEEKFSIVLPSGFRWLEAKIISAPSKVATIEVLDDILVFDFGLLKHHEYIIFEALGEVPDKSYTDTIPLYLPMRRMLRRIIPANTGESLSKALSFKYRIASVPEEISDKDRFDFDTIRKKDKGLLIMSTVFIAAITASIIGLYNDALIANRQEYYTFDDSKIMKINITFIDNDKVEIRGVDDEFVSVISRNDYFMLILTNKLSYKIIGYEYDLPKIIAYLAVLIFVGFVSIPLYVERYKILKLRRIIY